MANRYLSKFKQLFASGDSQYKLAIRTHFFVQFTFDHYKSGLYKNLHNSDSLGYLVQNIDIPNFVLRGKESGDSLVVKNQLGAYRIVDDSTFLPENNSFVVHFLDTELPLFEEFFYPWMQDVSTSKVDKQSGSKIPRATIYVSAYDNMNDKMVLQYQIKGAFPIHIDAPTLSYEPSVNAKNTRTVVFAFNEVVIATNKKYTKITNAQHLLGKLAIKKRKKKWSKIEKALQEKIGKPESLKKDKHLNKKPLADVKHHKSSLEKLKDNINKAKKTLESAKKKYTAYKEIKNTLASKKTPLQKISDIAGASKNIANSKKDATNLDILSKGAKAVDNLKNNGLGTQKSNDKLNDALNNSLNSLEKANKAVKLKQKYDKNNKK